MIPFRQMKIYLHHILPPVPISVVIRSVVRVILLLHNWPRGGFLGTSYKENYKSKKEQKYENSADNRTGQSCSNRRSSFKKRSVRKIHGSTFKPGEQIGLEQTNCLSFKLQATSAQSSVDALFPGKRAQFSPSPSL